MLKTEDSITIPITFLNAELRLIAEPRLIAEKKSLIVETNAGAARESSSGPNCFNKVLNYSQNECSIEKKVKYYSRMKLKEASKKSFQTFKTSMPILVGILLLINLVNPLLKDKYAQLFSGNIIIDPLVGAVAGSISFGIPITSYIAGGELLSEGVSLLAVTAFIIAWTTVGVAMLPFEAAMLGKKFAIFRNGINFLFSIIIAILVVNLLNIFQ